MPDASPPTRRVINFGRNIRFTPRRYYVPTSEAEVLELLNRHTHGKVRVVGALHSWSGGIVSDDALVDLRHFNQVEVAQDADGTILATVGGGCRIKDLLQKLHNFDDVTIPSLGLITEQTLAGAISTATHGSGKHSLSHYVEEMRIAAYDATGTARIYTWGRNDPELRAARCALGCMGIILAVRFRCVEQYDVAETVVPCDTLDEALAAEREFPLQQFYLLPHRWTYLVQRRVAISELRPRQLSAHLYRLWWYLGTDIGLHLIIKLLVSVLKSPRLIRFFYRRVLSHLILKNSTIVDRSDHMLVMEHELFRHLEMEIFVPTRHLQATVAYVRDVVQAFDGSVPPTNDIAQDDEMLRYRGTFTHHYPITFRRVLPDDCLLSMTSNSDEPYYAISFITYAEPREPFLSLASVLARELAQRFQARLHWGKYFPLDGEMVERLYPALPEFRAMCERVDPNGVFRNVFAERVLFRAMKSPEY